MKVAVVLDQEDSYQTLPTNYEDEAKISAGYEHLDQPIED